MRGATTDAAMPVARDMTRVLWRLSAVLAVVAPIEYAALYLLAPNRLAVAVVAAGTWAAPVVPWW